MSNNKSTEILTLLNKICEEVIDTDDAGEALKPMMDLESTGVKIPQYLKMAVMEFVSRNTHSGVIGDIHPWEKSLREFLIRKTTDYFTAYSLLTDAIGLDAAQIQRRHEMEVSTIMRSLGWRKALMTLPDSLDKGKKRQQWVYCRP